MNNKIVSTTKKISTIFFAIVLVTGTIALASSQSSFMVGANAQAQPYYGGGMDSYGSSNYGNDNRYDSQYQPSYKPDYKPKYSSYGKDDKRDKSKDIKSVDINKLKCINTNININGNNTGNINIGNKGAANAEEGYSGAYSSDSGSGYGGSEGYDGYKKDKGFDCVINNNNTNINGGGITPVPPEQKATLNVTKLVTCEEENPGPLIGPTCVDLLGNITEDQFNITVTDTNVSPSSFNGSEAGTIVTLDAGSYIVTETFDASIAADLATLGGNITGPNITFTGQCSQAGVNSTSATGTIAAGESQTCNIVNNFVINTDPCEQCFLDAVGPTTLAQFNAFLGTLGPAAANNLTEYCQLIADRIAEGDTATLVTDIIGDFAAAGITLDLVVAQELVRCLILIFGTGTGLTEICDNGIDDDLDGAVDAADPDCQDGIVPFDVPSGGTADSPTMAQETQLSAVEKMTKLKQQWLDLLP